MRKIMEPAILPTLSMLDIGPLVWALWEVHVSFKHALAGVSQFRKLR